MRRHLIVLCAALGSSLPLFAAAPQPMASEPLAAVATSPAASTAPHDPYFGLHIHHADTTTAWPKPAFGSWRLWDSYVGWATLEPRRGQWDFARLDRYVAIGERTGVELLLPLGLTPGWASARPGEKSSYQKGNAAEPADIEDWRRYVRTVAERYKGRITHYEIWNEVNVSTFFSGSTEKLVELTCEAHKILHAVSPDNVLASPSWVGAGSEPEQFETFLKKGGKACIDVVSYHFYVPKRQPEDVVELIRRVQRAMANQGVAKLPLWNTEFGWWLANADGSQDSKNIQPWRRIVPREEGPAVVARSLVLARWAGVDRTYWYAWDNPWLGLIEPGSGVIKPAGQAFETVARWMSFTKPQCQNQSDLWVCRIADNGTQIRRIAWYTGKSAGSFSLPAAEKLVAVEHLDGQRQDTDAAKPGPKQVALDGTPVLVVTTTAN